MIVSKNIAKVKWSQSVFIKVISRSRTNSWQLNVVPEKQRFKCNNYYPGQMNLSLWVNLLAKIIPNTNFYMYMLLINSLKLGKIFIWIIGDQLKRLLEGSNFLGQLQSGFRRNSWTGDNIFSRKNIKQFHYLFHSWTLKKDIHVAWLCVWLGGVKSTG